ncbi:putative transcriptional regulator, merR family [Dissulfuribacter thermophilus]|uniref:Putative transcriptional regulator, merR family n=1 Tax=Dissulfuribacter thermophilus TaxID=1156395 RepID=A0A1B9F9E6_9BACT|nr:MerR family transcriptional regulator [Dissulfuribacter thermophilus]OCC16539.1 putative transcriptional regulator, merR family [Dissulfuribacter thermophilus]
MAKREKTKRVNLEADLPVYPIGVAARMLGVHPRTLRIYEAEGLIKPRYRKARRLYSNNDIQWVTCLRSMIHDEGISIPGIKKLLEFVPCWKIMDCPKEIRDKCGAKVEAMKVQSQCGPLDLKGDEAQVLN